MFFESHCTYMLEWPIKISFGEYLKKKKKNQLFLGAYQMDRGGFSILFFIDTFPNAKKNRAI